MCQFGGLPPVGRYVEPEQPEALRVAPQVHLGRVLLLLLLLRPLLRSRGAPGPPPSCSRRKLLLGLFGIFLFVLVRGLAGVHVGLDRALESGIAVFKVSN